MDVKCPNIETNMTECEITLNDAFQMMVFSHRHFIQPFPAGFSYAFLFPFSLI
jgi:hypothetical protein